MVRSSTACVCPFFSSQSSIMQGACARLHILGMPVLLLRAVLPTTQGVLCVGTSRHAYEWTEGVDDGAIAGAAAASKFPDKPGKC